MKVKEAIQSIQDDLDRIILAAKDATSDQLHWKPAEDKWSVMEVLVHVEEAVPYWLDEIARLLEAPGSEWGRGLQDERRLAAVAAAGSRSLTEVLSSIAQTKQRVADVLGSVSEEALRRESPSRNPRFGTKPLSFVIEHLLVEHVAVHDRQIQRNLAQYREQQKES